MMVKAIPLYPNDIPNSIPGPDEETTHSAHGIGSIISKISKPTLTLYLPSNRSSPTSAIIICPGGGYTILAWDHEGTIPAKAFQAKGIAAFLLKYRIPDDKTMIDKSIGPLQDAQQAIKLVREHAKEWNVDPQKLGIIGFSAGGHLASTAGTHFDKPYIPDQGNISLRPNFQVLVYPVISMNESLVEVGSMQRLLGDSPSEEQKKLFSNERQITKNTPPAFLVHAADDDVVPVGNSIEFFSGLHGFRTPTSMHVYESGGHGFGMSNPTSKDDWFAMVLNWMEGRGMG